MKRGPYHKVTADELALIESMWASGHSSGQIALRLGWTRDRAHGVIQYYTKRAKEGQGPWAPNLSGPSTE